MAVMTAVRDIYGVSRKTGVAAELHVFGKGLKPCGKATQFFPQGARYPQSGTDHHANVVPGRI